ncbi:histone-lysine N-methyltransferase, H3 lysine-9 specific SUVH5-like [Rhododendron vialii]|uniref:histone-lysine N-methyltransferase, H3 lysine-9 specific SUVH5-like n=1 Tax=Rhododendron vialii TaxID=182163 RepID=UPI00265FD902|nr:histone-lysine N-methyltransferase, H3 lysine-9 specific SUVH5-like [Rhododendron vialii]
MPRTHNWVTFSPDVTPSKVREVLNLFQVTFTMLSDEDRAQAKEHRKTSWQLSMETVTLLKEQQKCVNTKKLSGPVPGVEIGDKFQFRAELVVIGLHRQLQSGIDYMEENGIKFATSIVESGRYGNDVGEFPNVLIFSGQGGNPTIVNKPPEDQKLTRGNLALQNSMDAERHVRVIWKTERGSQTTYTYYGLYMVTQCRQERGGYGKLVYKFVLHRLAGQPEVNGAHVGMPKKSKKSKVLKLPSVVVGDVSQGKEEKPVRAVNIVDDEKLPPFHYVTNVIYPESYESTRSVPRGCDCINGCLGFEKCPCTVAYGGDIPFTSEDAIVRRKPLVYECGPSCNCPLSCQNRVSQNGIRYHLEIFKTVKMGWGVRSRDFIRSGGFVCEYTGELLREQEAVERVGNDEYLFDIGKNGSGFTIDAAKFGNVGRFINHSCSPNLYAQNVLYDHDDKRMPHIMFFATKNIPPLRELTYDYNYKVDRVGDGNGDIKRKDCYCGSHSCSGRLY